MKYLDNITLSEDNNFFPFLQVFGVLQVIQHQESNYSLLKLNLAKQNKSNITFLNDADISAIFKDILIC